MDVSRVVGVIEANGLQFGYLQAGDPGRPLAPCLHGFPDCVHTWRHLLPVLADCGYHAVAPFMRGYAPTQVPANGAYQSGALVADATALHGAFAADDRAMIIGHDWGAMTAYGTIAFAPDRWRRAVTLAVPRIASIVTAFFDYEQIKRFLHLPVPDTASGCRRRRRRSGVAVGGALRAIDHDPANDSRQEVPAFP